MKIKAHAKINPGLDVLGRRDNGYHDVRMVMQTIGLYDNVTVDLTDEPGISLDSNFGGLPMGEENIAYRAAQLMLDEYERRCAGKTSPSPGVRIYIDKHIPMAAGMAGGSTDAAAVLKALNKLLDMGLSVSELKDIGVKLGADVPFCITGGTMLSEGIGEILTPLPPMPNCFILTANPGYSVSTKHAYDEIDKALSDKRRDNDSTTDPEKTFIDGIISGLKHNDLTEIAASMENVLELVTIAEHPDLDDIKKTMMEQGALVSLMSGSGPTVFGIFAKRSQASKAAAEIGTRFPEGHVYITVPCNIR